VVSRQIRLRLTEVRLAVPASAGVEAGMIVLSEDDPPGRALRIIIGQPEARAIHAAWDGSTPSRPSTWDLFVSAIAILGGRVERAVVTGVEQERHYFASIDLEQHGEHRTLACRPSDAVALALRSYGAGIFAEESVLEDAGVLADGTKPGKVSRPEEVQPADPTADRERELAEREAALAARERELAEREAAVGREQEAGPSHPTAGAGAPAAGSPAGGPPAGGPATAAPPAGASPAAAPPADATRSDGPDRPDGEPAPDGEGT
jgi:bifunctional DNase/RNase